MNAKTTHNNTYLVASLTLLIGVFGFLYFFTGVFGDTRINLTLNTNPNLEEGLVGHWTFDATDVNGFTVLDKSGSDNHGSIVATTTRGNDVVVDASLASGSDAGSQNSAPTQVWVSDQVGYMFYVANGSDVWYASTTDGGSTWNALEKTSSNTGKLSVWYDKWTQGEPGDTIHVLRAGTVSDQLSYATYNTQSDIFSDFVDITTDGSSLGGDSQISITKAEDGILYAYLADAQGQLTTSCSNNCTLASSWTDLPDPNSLDSSDYAVLMPLTGTNNVALVYSDPSTDDDFEFFVYSATSSSWWPSVTIQSGYESVSSNDFSVSYNKFNGNIYLATLDDADDFVTEDHDIDFWEYDRATLSWGEKSNVVTNVSGGLEAVSVAVDENKGTIYVAYIRRTTIGTATSANVYYKLSDDAGTTWSSEIGPINDTPDDLEGLMGTAISAERLGLFWKDTTNNDLYFATAADIGDYPDYKQKPGNIGQGIRFDGVDDYIDISTFPLSDSDANFTMTAWIKLDPGAAGTDTIVSFSGSGASNSNNSYNFRVTSGRNIECTKETSEHVSTETISTGEWHFVVCQHLEGAGPYLGTSINGAPLETSSQNRGTENPFTMTIGAQNYSGTLSNRFQGEVDDVRVYERLLSDEEILRLYQLGATTRINTTLNTNPDLENGLVYHATFDGKDMDISSSTAEILDRSGGDNRGDWQNHATTTVAGNIGQAIEFDGVDDYIDAGSDTSIDDLDQQTIALWVKLENFPAISDTAKLFDKRNGGTLGNDLSFCTAVGSTCPGLEGALSYVHGFDTTDGRWHIAPSNFSLGEWIHVTMSFDRTSDANDPIFYVNGESVSVTEQVAPSGASQSNAAQSLWIGGRSFGDQNLDGMIDDYRLYNRILSPAEVLRLYQLGATTKVNTTLTTNPDLEDRLVGHWTFDGPDMDWQSGNETLDRSGNGYHGGMLAGFAPPYNEYVVPGIIGQAVDFQDVTLDKQINVSNTHGNFSSSTMTVSAWIYPDEIDTTNFSVIAGTAVNGWAFQICDSDSSECPATPQTIGLFKYFSGDEGAWHAPTSSIELNEWQHVAVVYDNSSTSNDPLFYINGELVTVIEALTPTGSASMTTSVLELGNFGQGSSQFGGRLDDVRIYNRLLSADEIKRLYQLGQ